MDGTVCLTIIFYIMLKECLGLVVLQCYKLIIVFKEPGDLLTMYEQGFASWLLQLALIADIELRLPDVVPLT